MTPASGTTSDRSFRDRRDALHGLLLETRSFAADLGLTECADRLDETARQLLEERLLLVVCGEIKQGKSSLLGALYEDPELFPVDIDVATSRLTMVHPAEDEKLTVLVGPPGKAEARSIRREQIRDHVTAIGDAENRLDGRWLRIETPNPRLRDGLVVVDTPGISDIDASHMEITVGLLPQADLVLFVSDALAPLSQPELDFLSGHVAEATTEIVFVITKIDRAIDLDAILASNRHKLSETLGIDADDIEIFPVSSPNKLRFVASGDPEDLADSGFPELEAELERRLQGRAGTILLRQAFARFDRQIEQLLRPLVTERQACRRDDRESAETLQQELDVPLQRLRALTHESAQWRETLLREFQGLQREVLGRRYPLKEADLQKLFEAELEEDHHLRDPQALLARMEAAVARTSASLVRIINQRTRDLVRRTGDDTLVQWEVAPLVTGPIKSSNADLALPARDPESLWTVTVETSRKGWMSSMGGGIAVGAVGWLLGGLLGFVSGGLPAASLGSKIGGSIGSSGGGLAGLFTGIRQEFRERTKRRRRMSQREVRGLVAPLLRDCMIQLRADLDDGLTRLRDVVLDGFAEQLRQEQSALDQTMSKIQDARQSSAAEVLARACQLDRQIDWLEKRRRDGRQQLSPDTTSTSSPEGPSTEPPIEAGEGHSHA